jgi:hypothetical protein
MTDVVDGLMTDVEKKMTDVVGEAKRPDQTKKKGKNQD